jgi:hypothetical protein
MGVYSPVLLVFVLGVCFVGERCGADGLGLHIQVIDIVPFDL